MNNKTVLITGAAKRIGACIARTLHGHGANVVIHYHHSAAAANELAANLNAIRMDSALTVQGDLSGDDSYTAIVSKARGWKDRLDVLVNNASAFYPAGIADTTPAQWEELIGTNMKAPFFLAQQAAPFLRETQGCIVNITDIHAERPLGNYPVYSAAKAGLVMLTRALAKELGPLIRVNAVSPGAIIWPEDMDEQTQQEILSRTALKKTGTAEDIANAVRFLITDADYITGQVLSVDGGRTLYS